MPARYVSVFRGILGALLVAAASVSGGGWDFSGISSVRAQARPAPLTIDSPASLQIPPNREVPIPIKISPESAMPKQAMVLIRGLPSNIALTAGRAFDSGIWGIKPSELAELRINSLGGAGVTSQLSISVVTLDGTILAEAHVNLVVVTPAEIAASQKSSPVAQQQASTSAAASPETGVSPRPVITAEDKARVATLMQKGDEYLKLGNVLVARSFYAKASDFGSDAAMLALARTFDPTELNRAALPITVKPDVALAKKWYEKAKQLGSTEAERYLERLAQ